MLRSACSAALESCDTLPRELVHLNPAQASPLPVKCTGTRVPELKFQRFQFSSSRHCNMSQAQKHPFSPQRRPRALQARTIAVTPPILARPAPCGHGQWSGAAPALVKLHVGLVAPAGAGTAAVATPADHSTLSRPIAPAAAPPQSARTSVAGWHADVVQGVVWAST